MSLFRRAQVAGVIVTIIAFILMLIDMFFQIDLIIYLFNPFIGAPLFLVLAWVAPIITKNIDYSR